MLEWNTIPYVSEQTCFRVYVISVYDKLTIVIFYTFLVLENFNMSLISSMNLKHNK